MLSAIPSEEALLKDVLEHRLSLAAQHLKWSRARILAFKAGYAASCAGRIDRRRIDRHDNDRHGFLEPSLSPSLLDSLGYRDGVQAAQARSMDVENYRGDQMALLQIAEGWSANGNNDFDLNTAAWSDSAAEDLSLFLNIMDRQQLIGWFVAEHENAIECGRAGYGDLLTQDIAEHIVYIAYPTSIDVWDGWHRIGASMLKGAGHIPAIRGVPTPKPAYQP
jgi:hypothetical protein